MMHRHTLLAAVSCALVVISGQALGAGGDSAHKSENRFFVIGENSEYYRPGMPRPAVPTEQNAEVYFLRERLRVMERKYALLEQRMGDTESPAADDTEAGKPHAKGIVIGQHELPAPATQRVGLKKNTPPKPLAKKSVHRQTQAIEVTAKLPEMPPLVLATSKPGDAVTAAEVASAALPPLPSIPPARMVLVKSVESPAPSTEDDAGRSSKSDESVIEAAREIIEAARERVFALIASVAEPRQTAVAHAVMRPRNLARGVIAKATDMQAAPTAPPVQPVIQAKKEWVVLYRLASEQMSKQIASKLDMFRVPIGSREFLEGEYLMEVGAFEDESRARQRVTFLGYIVGVEPELRVRTKASGTTAGVHG